MNVLDIIFAIFIVWGVLKGLKKGFLLEITSLVALVLGIYGAIKFSYLVDNYLQKTVDWGINYTYLVAFILTFILVVLAVFFTGKILTKIIETIALGLLNKILGGVLGGIKVVIVLGVLLVFFHNINTKFHFIHKEAIDKSALYNPVKSIGEIVFYYALEQKEKVFPKEI